MWIEDTYRRLHLDFHMPDWSPEILASFDAGQIVSNVKRANADALYFFAKCHYGNAYYKTQVGKRHRNMKDRDFLAEMTRACRKASLTIPAYFSLVWDVHVSVNHPEWCMRHPDGQAATNPWPYICFNSPYRQYTTEMLKEVAAYDIDGIHFDMINFSFNGLSCYCDTCRKMFFNRTGRHIPEQPTWDETWRQFLRFRNETILSFVSDVRAAVHSVKPDLPMDFNYHGSPGFDWRAGQKPIMHTTFNPQGSGESYPAAFGVHYTSFEARFLKDLIPDRPAEIVTSRFNGLWDYTVKQEAGLKWELTTALSHGCKVMVVDQNLHDGSVDPLVYDRLAPVYREIEEKRELWGGTPLKFAALYYSVSSRDFYARGDLPKYLLSAGGAFRALVESHLPVDVLHEENCTLEKMRVYPVVVLANVAVMSDAEAEMFRRYVAGGGVLVSTGDTALHDEAGRQRRELILADVFGATYTGKTETRNHYLRVEGGKVGSGLEAKEYILCNYPGNIVEPTTGKPVGTLHLSFHDPLPPYQTFSHHLTPPWRQAGPAVIVNDFGKGHSLYTPSRVCAAYADLYALAAQRKLLANLVTAEAPPPLSVDAPLNVEVVVNEQRRGIAGSDGGGPDSKTPPVSLVTGKTQPEGRLIIHLIGCNPLKEIFTRGSQMDDRPVRPGPTMEEALLYRARIELPAAPKSVKAWSPSTELKVEGRQVDIMVSEIHEALIVET